MEHLEQQTAKLARRLATTIMQSVEAYRQSGNPELATSLQGYCEQLSNTVLVACQDYRRLNLGFVEAYAAKMARNRFPLEALLQGNRVSASCIQDWLRGPVSSKGKTDLDNLLGWLKEETGRLDERAAAAYVQQVRFLAEEAVDERAGLLKLLLDGYDESDARIAGLLRRGGYSAQRQSYCVIVSVPFDASEMAYPARGRRLVKAITDLARTVSPRILADVVDSRCVCIVSQTRRASGWTKAESDLATRLFPALKRAGNSVAIGISADVPTTSAIPAAYRQALHATQCASLERRVVPFSDLSLMDLLVQQGGEAVHKALPDWALRLFEIDDKARGAMMQTLKAYAANDMNVQRTARHLAVHANTIYLRLERILDATARDPKVFEDLLEMLIALRLRTN